MTATDAHSRCPAGARVGCLLALLLATAEPAAVAQGAEDAGDGGGAMRQYRSGPLTPSDFRAPPPDPPPKKDGIKLLAETVTELRYQYTYRTAIDDNRTTARLKTIDVFAVVMRDRSWNTSHANRRLMDHEQGHFDITKLYALRAQLELARMFRAGRRVRGLGRKEPAAVQDLESKVRVFIEPFDAAGKKEQAEYDRVTRHGTLVRAQAQWRKRQAEEFKRLVEELKPFVEEEE